MNMLHGTKIAEEPSTTTSSFNSGGNKRASLNARDFITEVNANRHHPSHTAVIKRQQSVSNGSAVSKMAQAAAMVNASSTIVAPHLKGGHAQQISLDSGIYSPSENGEEFGVTPVLI